MPTRRKLGQDCMHHGEGTLEKDAIPVVCTIIDLLVVSECKGPVAGHFTHKLLLCVKEVVWEMER